MRFTGIALTNWKNFQSLDIPLRETMYIVGDNAVGKSNLLDAFRFLHDLVKDGGGLQKALQDRHGLAKVRSLFARTNSEVAIRVTCVQMNAEGKQDQWVYELAMQHSKKSPAYVEREVVLKNGIEILKRPDKSPEDQNDPERLRQTALEQTNSNKEFRDLAEFFRKIDYLHLVPQLVKYGAQIQGNRLEDDPFGQGFLEKIANLSKSRQQSTLKKIQTALSSVVPEFSELVFDRDKVGAPHLKANYKHWRPKGAWQEESLFSDGTLRLIGLLWFLYEPSEDSQVLLLEEPEISLNEEIVKGLHKIFTKSSRFAKKKKQFLISTHSYAMLQDESIDATQIIILKSAGEGTRAQLASDNAQIVAQMKAGFSPSEVVLPASRTIQPDLPFFV